MAALARLMPATAVALAVALAAGATMGVAVANQADEGTPWIEVPHARIGDRATYSLTLAGEWLYQDKIAGEAFDFVTFAWAGPATIMDGEGRDHPVEVVRVEGTKYEPYNVEFSDGGFEQGAAWTSVGYDTWFEPKRSSLVGVGFSASHEEEGQAIQPDPLGLFRFQLSSNTTAARYIESATLCLAGESFQGQRIHLGDEVVLAECVMPNLVGREEVTLVASGVEAVGSMQTLVLEAEGIRIWVANGIGYPVRVEAWSTHPINFNGETGSGWYRFDLTGLEAGADARKKGGALGPAPPGATMAPARPWGPDASGVSHPFPPDVAFQKAKELNANFAALLRKAPDAYLDVMVPHIWNDGLVDHIGWYMSLTDGAEFVQVHVELQVPRPAAHLGVPSVVPPALGTYSATFIDSGVASAPTPAAVAKELPTVQALYDRWSHFSGRASEELEWSMFVGCAADCTEAVYGFLVQQLDYGYDPVQLTPPKLFVFHFDLSAILLDEEAKAWMFLDARIEGGHATAAAAAMTPPAATPVGTQATALRLGFLPVPEAAGVGLLAMASGIFYWLWPALKSGGLAGLFTRVQSSRMLEHPLRSRIADAVAADPGVHFQELARRTGIPNGTLVHHLRKLETGGHLVAYKSGRYTCYFPKAPGAAARVAAGITKSDGARAVLAAIQEQPGLTMQEVAVKCGLQASTVTYHVSRLTQAGLVAANRDGRYQRLRASA